MNDCDVWTRGRGRHLARRRPPEPMLDVDPLQTGQPRPMTPAIGLSRRALISGLGGMGLSLAGAHLIPPAAQAAQPRQCGGNPGIETLLALVQGTMIPNTLRAVDPRWPAYQNRVSPTIGFLYPPGWQPVDIPPSYAGVVLFSPRQDALVVMGSAQEWAYVPMDDLIPFAMQAIFAQFLQQPVGQNLCVHPIQRASNGEFDFAAAQNQSTLAAVSLSAVYSYAGVPDMNGDLVPTANTILTYYAAAGPSDQFAALTETVFVPIFAQLQIGPPPKPDEVWEDVYEVDDDAWGDEG